MSKPFDSEDRREKLRKFFEAPSDAPKKKWASGIWQLKVSGIIFLFSFLPLSAFFWLYDSREHFEIEKLLNITPTNVSLLCLVLILLVAIIFLLVGIVNLFISGCEKRKDKKGRATRNEIERWWKEDLKKLREVALSKADLDINDQENHLFCFCNHRLFNRGRVRLSLQILEESNETYLVFNPIDVHILYCVQGMLFSYRTAYDFIDGLPHEEEFGELYLESVVSFSSQIHILSDQEIEKAVEESRARKDDVIKISKQHQFCITTSGGSRVTFSGTGESILRTLQDESGDETPSSQSEHAVKDFRKKIRDVKKVGPSSTNN